ncbi:putative G-protein coupled receptor [Apostichopus japonicus]|uniref:Putative G-protein coupled receptor n=1 Tax=Stichopus japonicus TaxID=307972 RepID=A0A2G8KAL4_STIJA|nr:putative G-protein coupled receptor [Apostichopus japonicus]
MEADEEWIFDDINQRIIVASLLLIITAFGLIGNILTVVAVMLSKKLQTVANVFLLNLTIAAGLACTTLPFTIINMIANTEFGVLNTHLCSYSSIMGHISFSGTNVAHALIAFDRFYRITRPQYKYSRMFTKFRVLIMLCTAWLYASLSVIWAVVTPVQFGYSQKYRVCLPYVATVSIVRVTTIDLFILIFVLICYTAILIYIYRHNKKLISMLQSSIGKRHSPSSPKVTGVNERSKSTIQGLSTSDVIELCDKGTSVDHVDIEKERGTTSRSGDHVQGNTISEQHFTGHVDDERHKLRMALPMNATSMGDRGDVTFYHRNSQGSPAKTNISWSENSKDDLKSAVSTYEDDDNNDGYNTNDTYRDKVKMRKKSPKISTMSSHSQNLRETLNARQVKITINMFIVVAAYLICITPYMVCLIAEEFESVFPIYVIVFYALGNAINPALYAWKHPQFRQVFKPMVLLECSKVPEQSRLLKFLLG